MTNAFDTAGDLWIEVEAHGIPETFPRDIRSMFATCKEIGNGSMIAVTNINLTAYIRSLARPDWVNAALTSTSADIKVSGSVQAAKDWLATIPEPIEPKGEA